MLKLANKKYFDTKIIASAHLYFSVLKHLNSLLILARKIMIISNRKNIIENLQAKHPELCFDYIEIGINNADSNTLPDKPLFLNKVFLALPENMSGYLCLIGAGIWAEIYCTWVKQRGGVAIDIGSACDLLDGQITRPIHKMIDVEEMQKYKLQPN